MSILTKAIAYDTTAPPVLVAQQTSTTDSPSASAHSPHVPNRDRGAVQPGAARQAQEPCTGWACSGADLLRRTEKPRRCGHDEEHFENRSSAGAPESGLTFSAALRSFRSGSCGTRYREVPITRRARPHLITFMEEHSRSGFTAVQWMSRTSHNSVSFGSCAVILFYAAVWPADLFSVRYANLLAENWALWCAQLKYCNWHPVFRTKARFIFEAGSSRWAGTDPFHDAHCRRLRLTPARQILSRKSRPAGLIWK